MLRAYALVPVTTPWVAIASEYALSTMPLSETVVPITPQQTRVTGGASVTWLSPCAPGRPADGTRLVARGRLGPQVQLGPVGLDLPPDSQTTKSNQGQQNQLLHWCASSLQRTDLGGETHLHHGDGPRQNALQPSKPWTYRGLTTRLSSQTGSGASYTPPSEPKIRNRSNDLANHRSWVTASTVPS